MGAKFKVEEGQLPENLPEYGFSSSPWTRWKKLFENLPSPSEIETEEEFRETAEEVGRRTGRKLMEKEPTVPSRKGGKKAGFLGPHPRGDPLEYVSDMRRELKKDLERKLEKLKRRSTLVTLELATKESQGKEKPERRPSRKKVEEK